MRIVGEAALITGASRGIGRGIALKLAANGVRRIAVHYHRNEAAAEATVAALAERGASALAVQADVGKAEDVARLIDETRRRLGSLDILVCNARPEVEHFYRPPLELMLEHWQSAIDTQARAFLVAAQKASRLMSKGGRIIAVTYAPGSRTGSWQPWAAMGPAKAAMESLCRYFAVALAPRGITVNAVSPGTTDDGVLTSLPPSVFQALRQWAEQGWVPMRRLTTPADVGNLVAFLCSEEADFITGQTIHVDGGASVMSSESPLELQQAA